MFCRCSVDVFVEGSSQGVEGQSRVEGVTWDEFAPQVRGATKRNFSFTSPDIFVLPSFRIYIHMESIPGGGSMYSIVQCTS